MPYPKRVWRARTVGVRTPDESFRDDPETVVVVRAKVNYCHDTPVTAAHREVDVGLSRSRLRELVRLAHALGITGDNESP